MADTATVSAPVRKRKKESMWAQAFKRLMKNGTARFGLAVLLLLILLAIFAPYLTPYSYEEMDLLAINAAPSAAHPFGTDNLGRDCLTRIFYGGRFSNTVMERKTDYVKVAEGFGGKGYRAETLEELQAAMEKALKADGPVWIDCIIDREEKVLPMIPAGGSTEDMIIG